MLVGIQKTIINMYKFGQIEISSKEFNSVYQVQNDVNCEKIRISKGVEANKHDTRYIIGYETEPGTIVPLYIKTPRDCLSSVASVSETLSLTPTASDVLSPTPTASDCLSPVANAECCGVCGD